MCFNDVCGECFPQLCQGTEVSDRDAFLADLFSPDLVPNKGDKGSDVGLKDSEPSLEHLLRAAQNYVLKHSLTLAPRSHNVYDEEPTTTEPLSRKPIGYDESASSSSSTQGLVHVAAMRAAKRHKVMRGESDVYDCECNEVE